MPTRPELFAKPLGNISFEEFNNKRGVPTPEQAKITIEANQKATYREGLEKELNELRESEMWRTGATVRKLRPENK